MPRTKENNCVESAEKEKFHRLISGNQFARLMSHRMNEIIDKSPEMKPTVMALAVYPAVKWALKSRAIDEIIGRIVRETRESVKIQSTQSIVEKAAETRISGISSNREDFFRNCEDMVALIDAIIGKVGFYPERGYIYQGALKIITSPAKVAPTKYYINLYFRELVQLIDDDYGKQLKDFLSKMMAGGQSAPIDREREQERNKSLTSLLKEYTRLDWRFRTLYSDNPSLLNWLLNSEEETLKKRLSENESFREPYIILQYMRLIDELISVVGEFPYDGEEYVSILDAIIREKPKRTSDADISQRLMMSTFTYSIKRRRALMLMNEALSGNNINPYIDLMLKKV